MTRIYVTYKVIGCVDSPEYNEEVKFRTDILGKNHWSAISHSGPFRTITIYTTWENALLFKLKFADCHVRQESLDNK